MPRSRLWIRRRLAVLLFMAMVFEVAGQTAEKTDSGNPPVSVAQLIASTKEYDGKALTIQGEVIGDLMKRGDHAWVNILGDGVAIGVWMTEKEASLIHEVGRYGSAGDVLQVSGIFHRACPDHGGETDIHATTVQVLRRGSKNAVRMRPGRLAAGLGLCVSGGLLALFWRRRERKSMSS